LGPTDVTLEQRPDGSAILRSKAALEAYPAKLTDRLAQWALKTPDQIFLAMRGSDGEWQKLTYGQTFEQVQHVASALLERGLSAERPIAILSDPDLQHAVLALAAMHVGIPYAPISAAYSLVANDFAKLRHILGVLTPGLVFASDGKKFARAIATVVPADSEVLVAQNPPESRSSALFNHLLATPISPSVAKAAAEVGPDTVAKILFSSGSTGLPKGVINTQRMLCSNLQMILQSLPSLADPPPVIVDWLPWNHTFGGNHNFGIALYNGGSLYLDDGKPVPGLFDRTIRNLREIAPTAYLNVPKGFECIVHHMRNDEEFANHFFSRMQFMFYAGAGLSQHIWDSLDELATRAVGERIVMITGLGCTETAPSATFANFTGGRSGGIGVPVPGVDFKLVPTGRKIEARVRGPSVTPGYWRNAELTQKSFDEEGFFCTGDAVKFMDPTDISKGLLFDGRITEDFKLSSGTWVSVGPLRSHIVLHCAPLVRDVVLTGLNRDELGALIFPDLPACRRLCPELPASASNDELLSQPTVRARFQQLIDELAATATGSASRVARAMVLAEAPTVDTGEATDKGSLNCAAVLERRAELVERLYAPGNDPEVLVPRPLARADVA
jgi:feruloyl-CoA synthase